MYAVGGRSFDSCRGVRQEIFGQGVNLQSSCPLSLRDALTRRVRTNMFIDFLDYGNHVNLYSEEISRGGEGLGVSSTARDGRLGADRPSEHATSLLTCHLDIGSFQFGSSSGRQSGKRLASDLRSQDPESRQYIAPLVQCMYGYALRVSMSSWSLSSPSLWGVRHLEYDVRSTFDLIMRYTDPLMIFTIDGDTLDVPLPTARALGSH